MTDFKAFLWLLAGGGIMLGIVAVLRTEAPDSSALEEKERCFRNGGIEFHIGISDGSRHEVCVYRKLLPEGWK